jgi:nucleoside 2-deoxyribosyltransferase
MDYVVDSYDTLYLTWDWLQDMEDHSPPPEGLEQFALERQYIAIQDMVGVKECDVLVLLDEAIGWGCYVEMGAALALGKKVIVVSPHKLQVFFYHPNVYCVEDVEGAKKMLAAFSDISMLANSYDIKTLRL